MHCLHVKQQIEEMPILRGSIIALACVFVLVDAGKITINGNGCPVSPVYEKLLAHENCHQFYQCVNGRLVARDCPSGLLYNREDQICDWPGNVICKDTEPSDIGTKYSENTYYNTICNSNPSEAPDICAAKGSDGVLIAHEKCNQFYKCSHGLPVPLSCPKNLLYNPPLEACDWSENVKCGDRVIPSDNDDDNENGSGDGDENKDVEEDNNITNCDPSEAPTICAKIGSDGVLIAHEICNEFYKCLWGYPVALNCPSGLLYNSKKEQCDWPKNVICGERLIPDDDDSEGSGNGDDDNNNCDPNKAPVICAEKGSDGVLVAHENCNQFYKCSEGYPVALYCPSGLLYNPMKEQCDWENNVKCGSRIIPGEKDDEGNYDPSQAPKICANIGSNDILVAHEKCNFFYECTHGNPIALKCPTGLLYNPKKEICDWPKNVQCGNRIIPEEKDDEYKDNEKEDEYKDKEEEDEYKENEGNSDPSEAPTICAEKGSDSVLVAHEKCDYFYECAHGKPVARKCYAGLLFNPRKDICDWPENVKCSHRIIPHESYALNNGIEQNDYSKQYKDNSDPTKAPAICAEEGSNSILVAHEMCNHFYECAHGKPVAFRCPANLLYNPKRRVCDWEENVKCENRIIPDEKDDDKEDKEKEDDHKEHEGHSDPSKAPYICANKDNDSVLIAHEKCDHFYICFNGYPLALGCPKNLLYNPLIGQCDWPGNVKCNTRIIS